MREGNEPMKPDRETTYAGPAGSRAGRTPRTNIVVTRKRGLGDERGQAVTEFAMVIPLFAALVIVCVLFGKALYAYIQLTHTANEGARLAAVDQPQSGTLCTYLSGVAALPKGVTLTISYPDSASGTPQAPGEPVKITASTSASWVPIIGGSLGSITSSATMRIEQDTSSNTTLNGGSCSA